jgi:lysophospholipase L1-like esterase
VTRRRRWLFRLGTATGVFLVAAAVGEFVAAAVVPDVFVHKRMRAGGLFVPYEPGVPADLLADEFRVRFEGNRLGFRDRLDRSEARLPGRGRVLVLGDSFTAGWGVELKETYPYLLEDALGADVINAAKSGGNPLWFVAQARVFVPRLRPDVVLVQVYDNDPDDAWGDRKRFGVGPDGRLGELPVALGPEAGLGAAASDWWRRRVLPRRLRAVGRWIRGGKPLVRSPFVRPGSRPDHRVLTRDEAIAEHQVDLSSSAARPYHDPSRPAAWRERFDLQRALLTQLVEELRAQKVVVLLAYVPNLHLLLARKPAAELAAGNPYGQLLAELCAELRVPYLDGTHLLTRHEDPVNLYFPHDGHLNAAGHAHLAAALQEPLASALAPAAGD